MEKNELLEYLKKVKSLETQLFTLSKVRGPLYNRCEKFAPCAPQKRKEIYYCQPHMKIESSEEGRNIGIIIFIFGIVGIILAFIGFIVESSYEEFDAGIGMVVFFLLVGIVECIKGYSLMKTNNDEIIKAENEYQTAYTEYEENIKKEEEERIKAIDVYNTKMKEYEENKPVFDSLLIELDGMIVKAINETELELQEAYAQNIIYPKYQNLVAISSICEYFESGRCDSLEGANGAYNLYENELRQNLIIGQLSLILNNLEQIKNNQYSLYLELKYAQYEVCRLIGTIGNNFNEYSTIVSNSVNSIRNRMP